MSKIKAQLASFKGISRDSCTCSYQFLRMMRLSHHHEDVVSEKGKNNRFDWGFRIFMARL